MSLAAVGRLLMFAPLPTQQAREAICQSCPQQLQSKFCAICKCYIPFKIRLAKADCPLSKWNP